MNYDNVRKTLEEKQANLKMYLTLDTIYEILLMIRDDHDDEENLVEQLEDLADFVCKQNQQYYDAVKEDFV